MIGYAATASDPRAYGSPDQPRDNSGKWQPSGKGAVSFSGRRKGSNLTGPAIGAAKSGSVNSARVRTQWAWEAIRSAGKKRSKLTRGDVAAELRRGRASGEYR